MLSAITRCVTYDASISGDFFKHLVRIKDSQGAHFERSGRPVSAYSGDLVLEVSPDPYSCPGEAALWKPTGAPPPEAALELRFPRPFYRMKIPAPDIPITDDLEIVIFAKTGEELACIKGHI